MNYQQIKSDLEAIEDLKTKGIDQYNKTLIRNKEDVSCLEPYILKEQRLHRTYFQVSLRLLKNYQEQFEFIEQKAHLLNDWWHVDQLVQFIRQPVDFDYAYEKAKEYCQSPLTFLRRWGYVLFLLRFPRTEVNVTKILLLMKDDPEYYVQMAEAWILAELSAKQFELVYDFIKTSGLKYSILGKAIQKICDSFKITPEQKQRVKELRAEIKNN